MAYIVDIVIAAIIVFSVVKGIRKGLVKTAFSCLTLVGAILIAYFFGTSVGSYLQTTKPYEKVYEASYGAISERLEETARQGLDEASASLEGISDSGLGKTLERLGLDTDELLDKYTDTLLKGTENAKVKFAEDAAGWILSCLANAVGILVTFLAALIALKLLSFLFDKLFSLPVLSFVNKLGGLVIGLVLGILLVYILCMILQIVLPYIPKNPVIYPGMEQDTLLYGFFLNINPVIFMLFG